MFYRQLGRTGVFISEISMGGSPVPEMPVLLRAFEKGVNFIDTSHNYMNGNSERRIGQFLKEVGRENVYVGTKFHVHKNSSVDSIIETVNGSLKRLETDYLDVLCIHGVDDEKIVRDERVIEAFERLKKYGKYRFRGISCHSNHHSVVSSTIQTSYYDLILLAYNAFDIQTPRKEIEVYEDYLKQCNLSHLISLANSREVGIIAMKTLKVGAKRQDLTKYKTGTTSLIQAMLKWVLSNPGITSALTEMLTFAQLEEDLGAVGKELDERERKMLFRYVAENDVDYCRLCGECGKHCPSGIPTTKILHILIYYENYGKKELAQTEYSLLEPSQRANRCMGCGNCERACPYGVRIRHKLKEASLYFS